VLVPFWQNIFNSGESQMIKLGKYVITALSMGILLMSLSACKKGPAETAGKKIDNAVEKAGDSLEKTGDKIKDAVHDDKK
jgi:hypothetical protein